MIEGRLIALARSYLMDTRPVEVISGMAIGWDQAVTQAALELEIPVIAAIPFTGQELRWPSESQIKYRHLVDRARERHVISDGLNVSAGEAFQKRNEWMVDRCGLLVALWNGQPSGTGNCIKYALKQNRPMINLWNRWTHK